MDWLAWAFVGYLVGRSQVPETSSVQPIPKYELYTAAPCLPSELCCNVWLADRCKLELLK
jgi:hypothetical protein